MKEFPVKPLMCFELVKILLLHRKTGGIFTFSLSPLLNKITFIL